MSNKYILEYINSLKNIQIITNKKNLSENEIILEYINSLKTFNYKDYDCLLFLLDNNHKEIITQILKIYSFYLNRNSLSLIKDDDKRIITKILKIDRDYLNQFPEPLIKDYMLKYIYELQDNINNELYYHFKYMLVEKFKNDKDIIFALKEYILKYINELEDNYITDYHDNFLNILLFLLDNNNKEIKIQILQIYSSYLNRIFFSLIDDDKKIITKILEIDSFYLDRFADSILKDYIKKYINDLKDNFNYDHYYNFKNCLLDKFKDDKDIIFALKDYILKFINELQEECACDYQNLFFDSLLNRFKDDKDIIFAAVNFNFKNIKFSSLKLINTKEIILTTINNFNDSYIDGCTSKTDLNIITYLFENISDNMKDDKEIMLCAVYCYKLLYNFASNRLKNDKDIILYYLSRSQDWDMDSSHIIYNFLDNMENNLKDIIKDDKDIILNVIKINKKYIQLASTKLINDKDIVYYMVNINNNNMSQNNNDNYDLNYYDDNDCIEYFIKNLNNDFLDDKNIIMKLIKSNGLYIKYISDRLKNDKNVVLEAIKYVYYEYIINNSKIKFLHTPTIDSYNIKLLLQCIQNISNKIEIILNGTKVTIDNDILSLIEKKLKYIDNDNEREYFYNLDIINLK
jgi:hypothetical protein